MAESKPTVVFVAAEPKGVSTIRLGSEFRKIVRKARQFDFETLWAAQPEDVADAVQDKKPVLIHFSAHGTPAGNLLLEDEIGEPKEVTSKGLGAFLGAQGSGIRIVILNSCYSEKIARTIAQYVDGVVGMNDAIGIEAAIRFSTGLYRALAAGDSLHRSFGKGKAEINLHNLGGGEIPILLTRPGIYPNEIFLFEQTPPPPGPNQGQYSARGELIDAKGISAGEDVSVSNAKQIFLRDVVARQGSVNVSGRDL